jgi:hypothetical protein
MQASKVSEKSSAFPPDVPEWQKLLTSRDVELAAQRMRVSKLESLHKLAQDSALKCEADLVACHEALTASNQEKERLLLELDHTKCDPTSENFGEDDSSCKDQFPELEHAVSTSW